MLEYSIKSGNPEKQRNACVVVGVFLRRKLTESAEAFDEVSDRGITAITRRGDMDGKLGQTLTLYNLPNTFTDRVILVGLGRERDFDERNYYKAMLAASSAILATGARDAANFVSAEKVKQRDANWKLRQAVLAMEAARYRFEDCKSSQSPEHKLNHYVLGVPSRRDLDDGERTVAMSQATANGIKLARDLGNLPGNVCTPTYLAEQAIALGKAYKMLDVEILEQAELEKLKMGSFLSVSKGSREPPKLIVMNYQGGKKADKPIALVGKGLTFDAGGISLKPAGGMEEMKFDMCGSAAVFGTIRAIAEMGLPVNVVAVVPSCENMPDGAANKPGDIVTAMNGKTIEVINTDAEGRLILADALTYTERFEPEFVIDMATLTGACVVALGHHCTGMFTQDRGIARALRNAADATQDLVWEMPLMDHYQEQLKSNCADISNVGGRDAGAITAACFLSRFTGNYRWAHLDIAGSAWVSGKNKLATGRPVAMLTQMLIARSEA